MQQKIDPQVKIGEWFLIFQERCRSRWVRLLAFGRFKHVLAVRDIGDRWLVYDVSLRQTSVAVLPHGSAVLESILDGSVAVRMPLYEGRARVLRWGFWCVPAMAHLVGINSCAVRPDVFFRHCLQNGGEMIEWAPCSDQATAKRL